jgi:hypothetical protein
MTQSPSPSPRRYPKGAAHHRYKTERVTEADTGYVTPCHLWRLSKNNRGYGRVRSAGYLKLAHRVMYEKRYGPVRDGMTLDHLCKVPSCVNADHLEEVTQAENCRRGRRTKLTPDQVREIRTSPDPQHVLARRYGISQSQVSRIKRRRSWTSLK